MTQEDTEFRPSRQQPIIKQFVIFPYQFIFALDYFNLNLKFKLNSNFVKFIIKMDVDSISKISIFSFPIFNEIQRYKNIYQIDKLLFPGNKLIFCVLFQFCSTVVQFIFCSVLVHILILVMKQTKIYAHPVGR